MILKLTVHTYDFKNYLQLEQFLKQLTQNTLFNRISYKKIPLQPTTKRFTILKSPHVHKKAQEHFQYKLYKKVYFFNARKITTLLYLNFIISTKLNNNLLITAQFSK